MICAPKYWEILSPLIGGLIIPLILGRLVPFPPFIPMFEYLGPLILGGVVPQLHFHQQRYLRNSALKFWEALCPPSPLEDSLEDLRPYILGEAP